MQHKVPTKLWYVVLFRDLTTCSKHKLGVPTSPLLIWIAMNCPPLNQAVHCGTRPLSVHSLYETVAYQDIYALSIIEVVPFPFDLRNKYLKSSKVLFAKLVVDIEHAKAC
ncbi:hypothetical protein HAV15_003331 [Penicillium sp. str. |nr:hypothetical protein HAV15_003331 [Penicillium sp. str. \